MSGARQRLTADLIWTGERFAEGLALEVDNAGTITALGPAAEPPAPGVVLTHRAGQALLPGFVNAHSHAFQRGLRGRGETFPAGAGDFWSWREAMYGLAGSVSTAELAGLCRQAFAEMRAAGITSVGEFHYLHHAATDPERGGDFAFDEVVLDAARTVGIRLVLLATYYRSGGIGQPLAGGQSRFATPSPAIYWRQLDHLASRLDPTTQSLGAVAHSIRAADPGEIAELHTEAKNRGLPFHMHVEEQPREIADCRAAHGQGPLALLVERLAPGPEFTAVHCTHSRGEALAAYLRNGANVCLCPLTEANLGDGIADLPAMLAAGGHLCLGTDSNARISMLEEARWLEYGQRLARERRGVLRNGQGDNARPLLAAATQGGARALGLPTGVLAPGRPADVVAIDLGAPSLAGTNPESLLAALLLGSGDEVIAATAVGGRWCERGELADLATRTTR